MGNRRFGKWTEECLIPRILTIAVLAMCCGAVIGCRPNTAKAVGKALDSPAVQKMERGASEWISHDTSKIADEVRGAAKSESPSWKPRPHPQHDYSLGSHTDTIVVCPQCNGLGRGIYTDPYGYQSIVKCPKCYGTGKVLQ